MRFARLEVYQSHHHVLIHRTLCLQNLAFQKRQVKLNAAQLICFVVMTALGFFFIINEDSSREWRGTAFKEECQKTKAREGPSGLGTEESLHRIRSKTEEEYNDWRDTLVEQIAYAGGDKYSPWLSFAFANPNRLANVGVQKNKLPGEIITWYFKLLNASKMDQQCRDAKWACEWIKQTKEPNDWVQCGQVDESQKKVCTYWLEGASCVYVCIVVSAPPALPEPSAARSTRVTRGVRVCRARAVFFFLPSLVLS